MRFLRMSFQVLKTLFHRLGCERCPEAAASIGVPMHSAGELRAAS